MTESLMHDNSGLHGGADGSLDAALQALQRKAHALSADLIRRQSTHAAILARDRELSDFLENAAVGLHRVGPDGVIIWANRFELELFGYSAEEYIGRPITDFHVDRAVIADILRRLLAGETLTNARSTIRCKDGTLKEVVIHSNAQIEKGKFVSTRCFTHDVTDKVRLERELEKRLTELADLDRRKDEFLAMLGHELRNPLAPMMSALQLMRVQSDDLHAIHRARDVIERQAGLMKRLVDDLLDVSRVTQGKFELQPQIVLLADVAAHAVELAQPLMAQRGIVFTHTLPRGPVELKADPQRLKQALANLLNNAAKYTDGGGCVSLTASIEGRDLVLEVRDDGIGLDADMCERIFDVFVQEKSPLAQVRGGLGLGLTLVRRIAELHGGSATVASAGRGTGSTFTLRLPVVLRAPSMGLGEEGAPSAAPNAAGSRKVLVVDDNRDAAELLGELLAAFGHEAHVVYSGAEALQVAGDLRPHFVILDIGMPGMDGYETCRRLRAECGLDRSVFVALTGYTQKDDLAAARSSGFDHHLSKPVDFARLQEVLDR